MKHHQQLVEGAAESLGPILSRSKQAVYVYLDNAHKACNSNFSKMLGYKTPREWAKLDVNFPEVFVDPKSRRALVSAYQKAMENQVGSSLEVTWKRKDGKTIPSSVILVPYVHEGHLFALHFITKKTSSR